MNTKNIVAKINTFLADENGGEVAEWAVVVAAAVTAYNGPLATALNSAIAKVVSAMA